MASDRPSILDLHRAAGDATLGQTLIRLAKLAAAADAASPALAPAHVPASIVPRTHGRVRGPWFPAADQGGSARTESDR
ncbi:MAG: hypothetical protein AAGB29_07990 [Planctomycetota bacterium]